MLKNKLLILIAILVVIIIGETGFIIKQKSAKPAAAPKVPVAVQQSFNKGINNVFVQVRVQEDTKQGQFNDSIYYSAEEWSKLTKEEVQKAVEDRVNNWLKLVSPKAGSKE